MGDCLGNQFDEIFELRRNEADEFYQTITMGTIDDDLRNIQRQAFAGIMWSKQYYNLDIPQWLNGDTSQPDPPKSRKKGRNHDWMNLNNNDIISMPDKWEYPWYAAWDLAFHCVPLAMVDSEFAKEQLILFLREWYMKPNGILVEHIFLLQNKETFKLNRLIVSLLNPSLAESTIMNLKLF